jgi:hypothetical protein
MKTMPGLIRLFEDHSWKVISHPLQSRILNVVEPRPFSFFRCLGFTPQYI